MCTTAKGPVVMVLCISIVACKLEGGGAACSGAIIPATSVKNNTEAISFVFNLSSAPLSSAISIRLSRQ
jgi:hypothetical protein